MGTKDDKVGYKNPPVKNRIKKGEVRNPNGRPKLPKLKEIIEKVFLEEKDKQTALEAVIMALRDKALKGDIKAIELLLDRAYGKALQLTESKITNVNPETIIVKWESDPLPGKKDD